MSQELWDQRFLKQAKQVASWSKDPRGGVGAVIVDRDHRLVSLGFNGFAKGLDDRRTERYGRRCVLHAEENAILFARRRLRGCTLYLAPLPPCAHCASVIIQSEISRVVVLLGVARAITPEDLRNRVLAAQLLAEVGIRLDELTMEEER